MRVISYSLLLLFLVSNLSYAQKKNVSLEDIWLKGEFVEDHPEALRSLNNGEEYAILNYNDQNNSSQLQAYSYETGKKTTLLLDSSTLSDLDYFQSYTFNQDESALLLGKDIEGIYRRSKKGIYFVYDLKSKKLQPVSEHQIIEPTFSPDGKKIAYSYKNDLYIKELASNKVQQITTDGERNKIINGTTDWVYEEEFAFTRAYEWSTDSKNLAYLRFDESDVPEMTMEMYGNSPQDQLYPDPYQFKYPKAGENNSDVSLHIYNLDTQKNQQIDLGVDYEYLPRLQWTEDANLVSVQTLNRHQNVLNLIIVNATDYSTQTWLHEEDKNYIDVTDDLNFLSDNSFIWSSDQDNWNHLYHYTKGGKKSTQITKGNWDVTQFYGYNSKTKEIYYQSTENGSINRDVYAIKINGKSKKRLSQTEGTNSADFSKNFKYYINIHSDVKTPTSYTVYQTNRNKKLRTITDNSALRDRLDHYHLTNKELSTIEVNGNELNMWVMKPTDFDPNKKYPLFLYQYSGPGSQQVANSFFTANDYWHQLLTDKGYIVACIDGRGTGFKGADFQKTTQLQLGKYEVEDQIEAAKTLGKKSYIDKDRIGIWGWSYGGFMASNVLFQGADTFKMAIAVAPVTSWRFYDSVYTERFMTTPQENPEGYDNNSPLSHVNKLKGNFLLVHGSGDDNVHVQNSMQMIEALIQADKQFDWLIYPDNDHGIYGGNTRFHLYTKMTDFILNNL